MMNKIIEVFKKLFYRPSPSENPVIQEQNAIQGITPYIITIVFFLLSFIGILNHQMWRDEYQPWMIVCDAHSISELFNNLRYESNHILWHSFLYLFTSFTDNPFIMQVFSICISSSIILLVNLKAPFSLIEKLLLSFSYLIFFEYNIISRGYGLELLLIIIFCILYKNRHKKIISIALILFLLSNSNVFGFMISGLLACLLCVDYFLNRKEVNDKITNSKVYIALVTILLGWISGFVQMYPRSDSFFPTIHVSDFDPIQTQFILSRVITSYFAIPDFNEMHFWNTNFFIGNYHDLNIIIPILVVAIFALGFIKMKEIVVFYLAGTILILLFMYCTNVWYDRYSGHLFIILLISFWLISYYKEKPVEKKVFSGLHRNLKKLTNFLFIVILFVSFIGGVLTYCESLNYPFSTSNKAADYIKANKLQNLPIVGFTDYIISPLAAQLHKKIFYPERNYFGTFIIWDKKRNIDASRVPIALDSLSRCGMPKILLILHSPLYQNKNGYPDINIKGNLTDNLLITFLFGTGPGIVADEKYYIYLIERIKPAITTDNK